MTLVVFIWMCVVFLLHLCKRTFRKCDYLLQLHGIHLCMCVAKIVLFPFSSFSHSSPSSFSSFSSSAQVNAIPVLKKWQLHVAVAIPLSLFLVVVSAEQSLPPVPSHAPLLHLVITTSVLLTPAILAAVLPAGSHACCLCSADTTVVHHVTQSLSQYLWYVWG